MLKAHQILVRCIALAICAAALSGCGQKGPLFLPTDPAAQQRATLPQSLRINLPATSSPGPADSPAQPPAKPAQD